MQEITVLEQISEIEGVVRRHVEGVLMGDRMLYFFC